MCTQQILHKKGINIDYAANVHNFIKSQSQLSIKKVKEISYNKTYLSPSLKEKGE